MRFVPIKAAEQQAALMLHRSRDLLVRQRAMLADAIRTHFEEFGIVSPQRIGRIGELAVLLVGEDPMSLPAVARQVLGTLIGQLQALGEQIGALAGCGKTSSGANDNLIRSMLRQGARDGCADRTSRRERCLAT